jgi:hypothetical protein
MELVIFEDFILKIGIDGYQPKTHDVTTLV